LEALAAGPVIEVDGTVVTAGCQDIVLVEGKRVDHSVVIIDCSELVALGLLPDSYFVGASGSKCVIGVVVYKGPNTFFVLG
jgi:hypothetical protein